jgi:hypothetical protein
MVTVVTIHDLLLIAFAVGIWQAGLMRRPGACAGRYEGSGADCLTQAGLPRPTERS